MPRQTTVNASTINVLVRTGLALLLIFAQADAIQHISSHLSDSRSSSSDKQAPHAQACEKCLALAPLNGAIPVNVLLTDVARISPLGTGVIPVLDPSRSAPSYASRAPPRLV